MIVKIFSRKNHLSDLKLVFSSVSFLSFKKLELQQPMSIALHYSFRTLDHQLLFESENIQEKLVEQVYLKFCDLQRFPEWLISLENLTHINISSNVIEEIPESILKLSNLNYFDASDNRLTRLSSGLFELTQLRYLDVAGNFIERIPKGRCISFFSSSLNYCFFPFYVDISHLVNLEHLNFDRNFITEIPEEFVFCTSLVQISFDDCSRLFSIPHNLLAMPSLVNVSFRNCNLITFPSIISPSVKSLRINGNFLLNNIPYEVLEYLEPDISTSEFYLIDEKDIAQMNTAQ